MADERVLTDTRRRQLRNRGWLWLLLIPWLSLLPVGWYNVAEPRLAGFPFFYWYQLLWVVLSAIVTWTVYLVTRPGDDSPPPARELGDAHLTGSHPSGPHGGVR